MNTMIERRDDFVEKNAADRYLYNIYRKWTNKFSPLEHNLTKTELLSKFLIVYNDILYYYRTAFNDVTELRVMQGDII